jgi:hypothetical protein
MAVFLLASCDTTADGKRHIFYPEGQKLADGTIAPCDGYHTDSQACGYAKFNAPRLQKVELGMTKDDVRRIMEHDAERREADSGGERWYYMADYDAEKMTVLTFTDGRVNAITLVGSK